VNPKTIKWIVFVIVVSAVVLSVYFVHLNTDSWKQGIFVTSGAFLTLFILSFLYQDNPYYKFAEHLFVGVSAAYWMVMGFWGTMVPNLIAKLWPSLVRGVVPALAEKEPSYWFLIPLVLGILLLMRLSPKGGWISRWALAFIVGTTAGLNLIRYLRSDFIQQVNNTMLPLLDKTPAGITFWGSFSNIFIFVGVLCGLIYFFFSKEHKGFFGGAARWGILVLMLTFGAGFGYTVMARISLLAGRMTYLFGDWLGLIK
jgi:hypothetical protein